MMDFDIIKVPVKSILGEVHILLSDISTLEIGEIFYKMLYSLEYTHPFAKIAIEKQADDLNNKVQASYAFFQVIEFSADKYVPLNELLKDDNWNKYVIDKLDNDDYINNFLKY